MPPDAALLQDGTVYIRVRQSFAHWVSLLHAVVNGRIDIGRRNHVQIAKSIENCYDKVNMMGSLKDDDPGIAHIAGEQNWRMN